MKIQATKSYSSDSLNKGINENFDTSKKRLIGIALKTDNDVLLTTVSVQIKVAEDEVISQGTPATLFQSNISTNPNERFFSLFEPRNIIGKKFYVQTVALGNFPNVTVLFLLD
jgi:hypothetical protein